MDHLLGITVLVIIPSMVGLLAIFLPFRTYRRTGRDGFLTLGVLNAVFCGLAVLALLATAVMDGYPTFVAHLIVGLGFAAAVMAEIVKSLSKPTARRGDTEGGSPRA
jgi:hypothetical protein